MKSLELGNYHIFRCILWRFRGRGTPGFSPTCSGFMFFIDRPTGLEAHITAIEDPGLRERAASLPSLVMARWAPATTVKYRRGWVKWENWCHLHPESPTRPAIPFYICLYINDMLLHRCTFSYTRFALMKSNKMNNYSQLPNAISVTASMGGARHPPKM